MNENFVNIKVDREERPDVDAIYMEAVQLLTRRGGWPMTVFLTPDGQPYYGGTYFPPVERYGMPSFRRVLTTMADAWRNKREDVLAQAQALRDHLGQALPLQAAGGLDTSALDAATEALLDQMDARRGGLKGAPKFPQPMLLDFLLRDWARTGNAMVRAILDLTLDEMARGGIYDQVGGGFARYSVDADWLVPHFEKMLYDNAQLARLYVDAYKATGTDFYRRIAEETLGYVTREMTAPEGGFYSALDADSEGEEGKFYVWTPAELTEVLGEELAGVAGAYYGVTEQGNFEGKNILHVPAAPEAVARRLGMEPAALAEAIAEIRSRLYAARAQRVWPGRDDKVLTAWNGLMLRAFAEAGRALGRADYVETARRNADFVLTTLRRPDGRLLRTYKDGQARITGYLEDHAFYADGLLALYEATFEPRYFRAARELADIMLEHYADAEHGGFFDTADDAEALITRPKNLYDNAVPSGNSVAAEVLLRLAAYTAEERYRAAAAPLIEGLAGPMTQHPTAFGRLLCALDLSVNGSTEIAVVGDPAAPATQALLATVAHTYLPRAVTALLDPAAPDDLSALIPLLAGRDLVDGQPAAYVCRQFACRLPVTTPAALAAELETHDA